MNSSISDTPTNGTRETPVLNRGMSTDSSSDDTGTSRLLTIAEQLGSLIEESRVETDAIHPRFLDRSNLLYKCRMCGVTKARESKMQKHFFKNCQESINSTKFSCPLPECGGPSFAYQFKSEIRIYHSCKEWAKFISKSRSSSVLSSLSNSSNTLATSNLNGSITASSNLNGSVTASSNLNGSITASSNLNGSITDQSSSSRFSLNVSLDENIVPTEMQESEENNTNGVPRIETNNLDIQ